MANEDAIELALRRAATGFDDDLNRIGILYTNAIKIILSQHGSGRIYGNHQASAPGQPPAPDTGAYRASWRHELTGALIVAMYPGPSPHPTQLGGWLEYGTSKMAARPHARVATAQVEPLIGPIIAAGIVRREGV